MRRRACASLVVAVLLVGSWAAPAVAQTGGPTTPAAKATARAVAPRVKTAAGTVKGATADTLVLVRKDKKEMAFLVTRSTKVTRDGKTAAAARIARNDSATVTYTEADGKLTARRVTAKAARKAEIKRRS
ncbi:MAG: hypothetical protein ACREMB_22125 [Candidatus Rokuibacteriota bacterium]